MNTFLKQLLQWPPTSTTVIGVGVFIFGMDYMLTGDIVQATMLAGIFKILCPQDAAAVQQVEDIGKGFPPHE